MMEQGRLFATWARNIVIKIPIVNEFGESCLGVIHRLSLEGIAVNATAILSFNQAILAAKAGATYVSIFAGRVADTGRDPEPLIRDVVKQIVPYPQIELIWASPREILNVFQAASVGCHVITVTHEMLRKLGLAGKDLREYSLETVRMFYDDGQKAGYAL